jgi:hypothetical protein
VEVDAAADKKRNNKNFFKQGKIYKRLTGLVY